MGGLTPSDDTVRDDIDDERGRYERPGPAGAFDGVIGGGRSGGPELACAGARALVPAHLDDELSEAQARELRAHLLDCTGCRAELRAETNLRRWFERGRPAEVPVPAGFAARVARRALQGDAGIDYPDETPVAAAGERAPRARLLSFLLVATAAAAALLFTLAAVLQLETLPRGESLEALDYVPPWERAAEEHDAADEQDPSEALPPEARD